MREGIALAFITAMQLLTRKQRVAIVLRDALAWSDYPLGRSKPATAASA